MSTWGKIGYDLSNYSEADLELCLSSNLHLLEAPGVESLQLVGRQVDIGVGVVDLLARTGKGRIVVVEIKKQRIDCSAVGQLVRYLNAISEVLDDLNQSDAVVKDLHWDDAWRVLREARKLPKGGVTGVLVAPEIDHDASQLIEVVNEAHEVYYRAIKLLMVPALIVPEFTPRTEEEHAEWRRRRDAVRAKISEFVEGAPHDEMTKLASRILGQDEHRLA